MTKITTTSPKNSLKTKTSFHFQVSVVDFKRKKVGQIKLDERFWKVTLNEGVVRDVVVAQQAGERQGTKKTKTRAEVAGGGRKPWKQKGTGRARHGSIRSPIWRGGGVTFGPTGEENYHKKVNRKKYRKAVCMILSNALTNKKLIFWKNLDLDQPSTKKALLTLDLLKCQGKKVLFVVSDQYQNLVLSTNNLVKVNVITLDNLNPFALLNSEKILLASQLVPDLEKKLIYFE